ncbi:MAG: hypothetical protein AAF416_18285 [Pseudomonadota bacterium]
MLDAEADRLCGAGHYERSEARELGTKAGEVNLKVPKLRRQIFENELCRTAAHRA